MKIDRLLGILVMLSKSKILTAPQLAEQFEVSRRTINRDIEVLCMAGIPIITKQGSGGGICIQEGYKLDKNIFKENELSEIVTGLKALASINLPKDADALLNKIIPSKAGYNDVIKIELGSFWKESISNKIQIIKEAIDNNRRLAFIYYSKNGKSQKIVEPYYVIFKWDSWYVYGYLDGYRLYKLNRLWDLEVTDDEFAKRDTQEKEEDIGDFFEDNYMLKAVFAKSLEYRLVEEYGNKSYTILDDGLLFERSFTNYEFMLRWVLSFGEDIEVLEPNELREDIKAIASSLRKKYKSDDQ